MVTLLLSLEHHVLSRNWSLHTSWELYILHTVSVSAFNWCVWCHLIVALSQCTAISKCNVKRFCHIYCVLNTLDCQVHIHQTCSFSKQQQITWSSGKLWWNSPFFLQGIKCTTCQPSYHLDTDDHVFALCYRIDIRMPRQLFIWLRITSIQTAQINKINQIVLQEDQQCQDSL